MHYQAIVAEAAAYLAGWAEPLRGWAQPYFDKLVQGEFSQVIALLPYWLNDLVPTPAAVSHRLGLAHFYFWWYYYLQDELLDEAALPTVLLSAHLVLLKMVETYEVLGVTRLPCWADYLSLAQRSAEAHAVEWQSRFHHVAELTPARLAPLTLDFIAGRFAPLVFNTTAQLALAGISTEASLYHDAPAALRCFALVRQIGDDAGDWLADLRAGQLNYVSARLMRRLYETGQATSGADLDPERLAGYQLRDEIFWAEIEQAVYRLTQQALAYLAPYGDCRWGRLIEQQLGQQQTLWAAERRQRARWRRSFGLPPIDGP